MLVPGRIQGEDGRTNALDMRSVTQAENRSGRGSRRRRTAAARTEAILATSLDLFARRDFTSVTVRDIARACGINIALIYYYFGSKEELFRASIEYAIRQAVDRYRELGHGGDPIGALNDWLDTNVQLFEPLRKMAKVIIDYSFSGTKVASIDRLIRRLYRQEHAILADSIRRGVAEGLFRPVDPDEAALFVSTHLDGAFFASMSRPDGNFDGRMENLRRILWDYLAVRPAPGTRAATRPRTRSRAMRHPGVHAPKRAT